MFKFLLVALFLLPATSYAQKTLICKSSADVLSAKLSNQPLPVTKAFPNREIIFITISAGNKRIIVEDQTRKWHTTLVVLPSALPNGFWMIGVRAKIPSFWGVFNNGTSVVRTISYPARGTPSSGTTYFKCRKAVSA